MIGPIYNFFLDLEAERRFGKETINKIFLKLCRTIQKYSLDDELKDYVEQILKIKNGRYTRTHIMVLLTTYSEAASKKNRFCRRRLIKMFKKLIKKGKQ